MWPDEWADLGTDEPLIVRERLADNFAVGVAPRGWGEVCRWASCYLPGQWTPKDKGLTWSCGSRHLWVVESDQVEAITSAVSISKTLGLRCGWSIGSAARSLLKYIGRGQYPERGALRLVDEVRHGYYDCRPGIYEMGALYDVSSYYYTMWCRLPALRCSVVHGGRLIWHSEPPEERRRRDEVAGLVAGHKLLRNALVGCSQGRRRGQVFYCRGVRRTHPGGPGLFLTAACLVVRSGWELTRLVSLDTASRYSRTDSVLTVGGEYPQRWEDYGFRVGLRAAGEAEVCSEGLYRVGQVATHWYVRGSRLRERVDPAPPPSLEYHPLWLTAA